MKSLRLSALAAALVLAACSSPAPTESAAGSRPSFDDGPGMMGSGNGAGTGGGTTTTSDGGNTLGSGDTTSDTGGTTTSTDSTGAQRGGGMLGSGN